MIKSFLSDIECLSRKGIFTFKGSRGCMSFTLKSPVIHDFRALAEDTYAIFRERSKKDPDSLDGYPYSKPGDLRPMRHRTKKDPFDSSSGARKAKRMIMLPNLNDSVFVIFEGRIYQALISGMRRDICQSAPAEGKRQLPPIIYSVAILGNPSFSEDGTSPEFKILESVSINDIYDSADAAAAAIARNTVFIPKALL